jgi:hypothetical protein
MILPVPRTHPFLLTVRTTCVANDESKHVALPKLFGAPAYARPPVEPVVRVDRPFDPDALPLESALTEEERQLLARQTAVPTVTTAQADSLAAAEAARRRSLKLPSITGLLRGGGSAGATGATGGFTEADGATATIGAVSPAASEPEAIQIVVPEATEGAVEPDGPSG